MGRALGSGGFTSIINFGAGMLAYKYPGLVIFAFIVWEIFMLFFGTDLWADFQEFIAGAVIVYLLKNFILN